MRVAVDVNPLAGPRTGIGTYLAQLLDEIPRVPDPPELIGLQLSLRARTLRLPGVAVRRVPVPAMALHALWSHTAQPPVTLLTGRVDVVHGPNFVAPPAGRRAATVITVHDLTYLRFPELVTAASLRYRELVPAALSRGALVVTPSETVAGEVRDAYGLPVERVRPTLLGVGADWFDAPDPRPARPPELADDYLLFVGSREPRKNLSWLLAAYRQAAAAGHDVPQLALVGPQGWGPDELPAAGDRPPVLLGYRGGAELRALVAGARAMVCPACYEGFGLTPLEALAAGTPVIASDIAVHREVLGTTATFVTLDDVDALAAALADPPPRTPEQREHGRDRAAGFTWAGTAAATVAAYRAALAAR
ncbi:glycosyltransferase family 4 protein [Nakamurella deserti]|uniref:glycosyltransferase family 4 protein n=1 Tax=Nakamurella deserti TaxID=2164074 RepID=UPI000DBE92BA|nr:glycosyltransferase family 1 protein [Nakamurella deserti]